MPNRCSGRLKKLLVTGQSQPPSASKQRTVAFSMSLKKLPLDGKNMSKISLTEIQEPDETVPETAETGP